MTRVFLIVSASLLALNGAQAGDLRTMMREPGGWEVTMSGGMLPTTSQSGCYAGDSSVTDLANRNMKNCSQKSVRIDADLATVDAVCQFQGLRVTVHSTIRPTGETSFHSDSQVDIAGLGSAPGTPGGMAVSVDGHRTGPCRPGDTR